MDNKSAVIIGADGQMNGLLAAAVASRGVSVEVLTLPGRMPDGGVGAYASQAELLAECDRIAHEKGAPDYLAVSVIEDPEKQYGMLHEMSEENWRAAKRVSVDMVYGAAKALIAPMTQRSGRVLFIGALGGVISTAGQSVASAMSAGTATLMQAVAAESNGVLSANALLLGPMDGCRGGMDADEKLLAHIPKHRKGHVEEAVSVAVYTLLDAPDYFSGNVMRLDGGLTASYMREW